MGGIQLDITNSSLGGLSFIEEKKLGLHFPESPTPMYGFRLELARERASARLTGKRQRYVALEAVAGRCVGRSEV